MKNKYDTDSIHLTSKGALPYYRSINSLAIVVRYVEKLGINATELLAGSGIHTSDLDDPDVFVTPEKELLVLRRLVTLAPDPKIGLIIGQQYHVGIHGKVGAAAISSDTLLDAIRIALQYIILTLTYFQYDLKIKDKLVFMKMKELIDLKDIRIFVCEKEFVSVHRMAADVLGMPLSLNEVRLAYPKPAYAPAYQDIFQCPVQFNAEEHMMIFDSRYLFMQLPMANPLVRKTYEKECIQLCLRLKTRETITDRVRQEILFRKEGLPSFSQLARSMNISVSTLRRHLTEEGTSYKAISADIRKKMAINLIQTTTNTMDRIAAELGYSDLANFYRAFKGWTGHNPSYYRKKN